MKSFIKLFVILLAIGGVAVYFSSGQITKLKELVNTSLAPCSQAIHYRIGSIDPKFNLSQADVLADTKQATALWNETYGHDLFQYDPKGEMPVSFVYDERQALNTQINQLQTKLNTGGSTLDKQMADYKQQVVDYESKLKAYNDEVQKLNAQGGASPDDYSRLTQEAQNLKTEADSLNATAKQLNVQAKDYNSQVGTLNTTIDSFNTELSQRPEEGIFIAQKTNAFDPGTKQIEIYFVPSKDELIHTLAHEFGHSLGIEHNTNPKSIMFSYTSKSLNLSKEDLASLTLACRQKTLGEVASEKFSIIQGNYQRLLNGQ